MKATNEYRIIDSMGIYYPQRKYIGWSGRVKWKYMGEWRYSFGDRVWFSESSGNKKEIVRYIAETIVNEKRYAELAKRGTIVVEEIKA